VLPLLPSRAALEHYHAPRPTILTGDALHELENLQASILRFGLLNPVVVAQSRPGERFRIIDGRKRVLALKRLAFMGKLPRSLDKVPYILADAGEATENPFSLLSNLEQYEQVMALVGKGLSDASISLVLYASKDYISDLRCVEQLSERLQNAFFGGHIDLSQARAFATLPNPESQDTVLLALGPFAKAPEILDAISAGETVVSLGVDEDDILILPSRNDLRDETAQAA